ncbi:hypothetical protein L861_10615 [Litchfieldella anticariensis FP35 = DSM 16096]|uniref:Uncharacterized protein n=1 Tax=Litchfieldella anticariensis (strain DSM 16096 / CECT 5854 / CIP 108499 / LMG 22089 / FP35) TaxID=1121939 RepID=S2L8D3_LITA3|nr:isopentenyl transferase family protein [Halomonas anticariensis]EPC01016.1 hypothetical protein L861_10615 [Halomonas anticariensis FP35 = DSM 16096]
MRRHYILGTTASGKTSASISLAEMVNAPVVVLDRIQCFQELWTVSSRPQDSELGATKRFYLDDREISHGNLGVEDAYTKLVNIVDKLSNYHSFVILEGGSVSLCRLIVERAELCRGSTVEIRWNNPDDPAYVQKIRERVVQMMEPRVDRRSIVDELKYAWDYKEQRDFITSICGFDGILSWCDDNNFHIEDVDFECLPLSAIGEITDRVAESHRKYARTQFEMLNIMEQAMIATGVKVVR